MTIRISIKAAHWPDDIDAIRQIRSSVFIDEQQVPAELEWDGLDEQCYHWLAYDNHQAIGCCRMQRDGHIGRMAVLPHYRSQGIGRALLSAAIEQARQLDLFEAYLYAQTQALPFYQKAGFIAQGEPFQDAGIAHRTMRLALAEQRILGLHSGNVAVKDLQHDALDLIRQTSQQLRILSYALDHQLYDTPAMAEAISALARKSRYTEVRLMLVDPAPVVRQGHRLLTLQRRLSSNILLRRCTAHPHDIKDNLIIADQTGLLVQSVKEPTKAWANYNNRPVAENYRVLFDDYWEHAVVDKNLLQLSL